MRFEEIDLTHAPAFLEFVRDVRAHDPPTFAAMLAPSQDGDWNDLSFAAFVRNCERERLDWRPKAGRTSITSYVAIDGEDVVGFGRLRFPLTPALEANGGNVVFTVPPARRGRGWGTLTLNRLLFEGARAGLARALVTCAADDEITRRCIERNRGESAGLYRGREKFWIPLR